MRKRSAFSLIELLVVIGIIAILAAILFPLLTAARSKAIQTQCVGNLKQIGVATGLYILDNGERFPMWGAGTPGQGWVGAVQKYSKTKLMSKCPGLKKAAAGFSYWRNVYTDYWSPTNGVAPPLLSEMVFTRSTVFIICGPQKDNDLGWHTWWGPPTTWFSANDPAAIEAETRHNGGVEALFVDGHVAWVKRGGFQSTCTTTDNDPLVLKNTWLGGAQGIWARHNDGSHPWFRSN